ncbi:hypothetical protein [Vibrio sp.]|uniref:hypothetical protein n=1 Tax=Vibrio sp. TaxID=678 RepID=UPI003AA9C5D0
MKTKRLKLEQEKSFIKRKSHKAISSYFIPNGDHISKIERSFIPFVLETVALLTAFIYPNRIDKLCSWGCIHLSSYYNFNYFEYIQMTFIEKNTQTVAFGVTSTWKLLYNTSQKG